MFRTQTDNPNKLQLVRPPLVLQLPNTLDGAQLYNHIDNFNTFPIPYTVHYVKFKGQACSKCTSYLCKGCDISRHGEINLCAQDGIAIQFEAEFWREVSGDFNQYYPPTSDHSSVATKRPDECLTLDDCM